jgi:hypothetical protein
VVGDRRNPEEADVSWPFHKEPFLQHLPETLSKVGLGFLKDLNTPEKSDSSGREERPAAAGRDCAKGLFVDGN